jgi:hypothetical protein
VGEGLGPSRGSAPCRRERERRESCFGLPRDSGCLGGRPRSGPSRGANARGSGPDSRSHGLPQLLVDTISCAWQHHSPSGLAVLHLELELKQLIRLSEHFEDPFVQQTARATAPCTDPVLYFHGPHDRECCVTTQSPWTELKSHLFILNRTREHRLPNGRPA